MIIVLQTLFKKITFLWVKFVPNAQSRAIGVQIEKHHFYKKYYNDII
eukprot:UN15555